MKLNSQERCPHWTGTCAKLFVMILIERAAERPLGEKCTSWRLPLLETAGLKKRECDQRHGLPLQKPIAVLTLHTW